MPSVTAAVRSIAESTDAMTEQSMHQSRALRHSLRTCLPAPYDGVVAAADLYIAGYLVKVPITQSWLDNARYYESEYFRGANPDLLCCRLQYALEMNTIMSRSALSNERFGRFVGVWSTRACENQVCKPV